MLTWAQKAFLLGVAIGLVVTIIGVTAGTLGFVKMIGG